MNPIVKVKVLQISGGCRWTLSESFVCPFGVWFKWRFGRKCPQESSNGSMCGGIVGNVCERMFVLTVIAIAPL